MDPIADFDLTPFNTMGLAARARFGALVTDSAQLSDLSRFAASVGLPLHVIGGGSNLVLRDVVEAVVAVMGTKGRSVDTTGHTIRVTAAAGEDWAELVGWTVGQGFGGIENLALIPGTVGAAPVQNIGAYGLELADRFHALTAWDSVDSTLRTFNRDECGFSYRQSVFKQHGGRFVVLDVTLDVPRQWTPNLGYAGLDTLPPTASPAEVMERVVAIRRSKLPDWRVLGNAGSFFHNPVVDAETAAAIAAVPRYPQLDGSVKLSAAWLIESVALKGHRIGNAGIYDKHALIVVNHGGATYAEVAELADLVRSTVSGRYGIALTQEPFVL